MSDFCKMAKCQNYSDTVMELTTYVESEFKAVPIALCDDCSKEVKRSFIKCQPISIGFHHPSNTPTSIAVMEEK